MPKEYQIARLLLTAKENLVYCQVIADYPEKNSKKNYDVFSSIDQFYKAIHNLCFNESLLIVSSLLDKDRRAISFRNWAEFVERKSDELRRLEEQFSNSQLRGIRDQIVAHQDINNSENRLPDKRRGGMINKQLVNQLQNILDGVVKMFCDYAKTYSTPYSLQYFNNDMARKEITSIIELAKPKLTDDIII